MAHALDLALRGWGRVSSNPLVGAVILQGEEMVGEGWHAEFGGPHAERMALAQAGDRARGATAVVTLEPCAHQGKQPPCVEALLAAGVARVVCAMADPNPEAAGGGVELQLAGVEVEGGVMEAEARRLNAPFVHRFTHPDRPWVALKLATSREGWIAPADRSRVQLSGPESQEWVHWLRAGFDAIGVGGATAIADDPSLTVRGELQPRVPPVRIVFGGKEPVPPTLSLLTDGGPPAFVVRAHDLAAVLREMKRSGNIGSLLVEGGGRLAAALVTAGLVDRFYWIETPVELGGEGIPAFAGLPGAPGELPGEWLRTERKSLGQDTLQVLERI
jgi:diaminohydroxyphosphoribosylaminopyrimidine deaminase/5-amino-6-(5-phosphoribosylamino)uracil reductase